MTFRILATCLAVLAIGTGCASTDDHTIPPEVSKNSSSTLGDPAVYARIDSMTSCTALQRQFDVAGDNTDKLQAQGLDADVPLSYMRAAHTRMREVGCY